VGTRRLPSHPGTAGGGAHARSQPAAAAPDRQALGRDALLRAPRQQQADPARHHLSHRGGRGPPRHRPIPRRQVDARAPAPPAGWNAPSAGAVRLDGADVSIWPKESLGGHIGYLPQDIELFADTVAANISRFQVGDDEKVIEAAKLAGVHDMILRLPKGY